MRALSNRILTRIKRAAGIATQEAPHLRKILTSAWTRDAERYAASMIGFKSEFGTVTQESWEGKFLKQMLSRGKAYRRNPNVYGVVDVGKYGGYHYIEGGESFKKAVRQRAKWLLERGR